MIASEIKAGMLIFGRNQIHHTEGIREILWVQGARLRYQLKTLKFTPCGFSKIHQRAYTCSMSDFLTWAIEDVTPQPIQRAS
ncbi:hypothetical protein [Mesoterricola silvestris]|uniref:hypothetical protein n=1 Tax=Mesoterricola silvestris TaxID=2927979 RepID=UPI00292E1079|nr:hypothetical protein [Mesoterricola silvestris]